MWAESHNPISNISLQLANQINLASSRWYISIKSGATHITVLLWIKLGVQNTQNSPLLHLMVFFPLIFLNGRVNLTLKCMGLVQYAWNVGHSMLNMGGMLPINPAKCDNQSLRLNSFITLAHIHTRTHTRACNPNPLTLFANIKYINHKELQACKFPSTQINISYLSGSVWVCLMPAPLYCYVGDQGWEMYFGSPSVSDKGLIIFAITVSDILKR